ncbi:MAG: hypothetical protein EOP24_07830 [Hyphomicrobiales bacterium]|nr:MAG: hypothetical protein EOP24_07830 [Hyphomicrobiales bacterium]
MILQIYIDDETHRRLYAIALETGREVDELAESAVSEAALTFFRSRNDDAVRSAKVSGRARR